MTNAKNIANETNGIITVGENNIGIYSKDSVLKNSGTINVTHNASGTENIGVHNVTDNGNFTFSNSGTVNVNGVANIGISAKTTGSYSGMIELSGGTISVTASVLLMEIYHWESMPQETIYSIFNSSKHYNSNT